MAEQKNFPPPASRADEVIAEAVNCLKRDIWDRNSLDNNTITIRKVRFCGLEFRKEIKIDIPYSLPVDVLGWGRPTEPYQAAFKEAYDNAMERERARRMAPLLKNLKDDEMEAKVARWRGAAIVAKLSSGLVGIALVSWVVMIAVGGITSCSEQSAKAEAANHLRDNEVNKAGFKRRDFSEDKRVVYPDYCADGTYVYNSDYSNPHHFIGLAQCRSFLEEWERKGEDWIDWKAAP